MKEWITLSNLVSPRKISSFKLISTSVLPLESQWLSTLIRPSRFSWKEFSTSTIESTKNSSWLIYLLSSPIQESSVFILSLKEITKRHHRLLSFRKLCLVLERKHLETPSVTLKILLTIQTYQNFTLKRSLITPWRDTMITRIEMMKSLRISTIELIMDITKHLQMLQMSHSKKNKILMTTKTNSMKVD